MTDPGTPRPVVTSPPVDARAESRDRRRRPYLLACVVGLLAIILTSLFLVVGGTVTAYDYVALPALLLGLVAAMWLFTREGPAFERGERTLLALTAVGLGGKVAEIMFSLHHGGAHDLAIYADTLPWLALVPALASIVLAPEVWPRLVGAYYAVIAVLGVVHVVPGLASGETTTEAYLLARTLLANVALAVLVAVGTRFHREWVAESLRADAMRVLALTDELTRLPNRRNIGETFEREVARSRRYGREVSVVAFDIDHFKRVNDTFGHAVGDEVLRAVAARVREVLRASDFVGRWGGEEFLVVAPETGSAGAATLAEKLRAAVEALRPVRAGVVTASWGVATLGVGEAAESVLRRADDALYAAKSGGRNRVVAAEPPAPVAEPGDGRPAAPG